MQGTRVRALVREDPTCRGAAKPVRHNYWSPRTYSPCSATREATTISPHTATKSSPRSLQLEKSPRAATKTQCRQKKKKYNTHYRKVRTPSHTPLNFHKGHTQQPRDTAGSPSLWHPLSVPGSLIYHGWICFPHEIRYTSCSISCAMPVVASNKL